MLKLDPVPQIWGITGNLGGGKTLSAVSLATYALARGYFVVSNVTLNVEALSLELGVPCGQLYQHFDFDSDDFDPFQLPCGSPRGTPGGKRVLVIMDECAEWIDQYASAQNPRIKRFKSWLRHSSKRSQDVILIVQRLDYMQKDFRIIISKWVVVDDLRVWRVPVLKSTIPFMGGYVMQRVFDRNKKLVQGPCIVRKAYFGQFYSTAECLNSDGASYCFEYQPPRVSQIALYPWVLLWLLSLLLLSGLSSRLSSSIDSRINPRPIMAPRPAPASRPLDCVSLRPVVFNWACSQLASGPTLWPRSYVCLVPAREYGSAVALPVAPEGLT